MGTGNLIDIAELAERLSVSTSWCFKNYHALPHVVLPNTDAQKRKLIRFNWQDVIEFLENNKGGDADA